MRSFVLKISQVSTFVAPEVKTFANAGRHGWTAELFYNSTFQIEGFKNIDLYGIAMIGNVRTQKNAAIGQVNVTDFSMDIFLDGQLPLISGGIKPPPAPNYWNLYVDAGARTFNMSKFTPKIEFADPVKSVREIQFGPLKASGSDWDTVDTASLEWQLTFEFFYKYEGE